MLLKKAIVRQIAGTSRAIRLTPRVGPSGFRYMSTKNDEKKPEQPQSILTNDLLAKAGFEELSDKEKKASVGDTAGKGVEGEELGSPEYKGSKTKRRPISSTERKREKYANWFYIATFGFGIAGSFYLARNWDSDEEQKKLGATEIEDGYTFGLMSARFSKRLDSLFTIFQEPAFDDLLPPPPPEAYRRPLTLVLTLDDLLIHSEWSSKNGWRTAKRPGLDYFLGYLSQYYEIVVFSSNYQMYSEKAVTKLDPLHAYISYALFREACRYKDGKIIKDISLMNRDVGKIVTIDVNSDAYSLQPENAIPMKPWDGTPDDTLIKLIPFLEYLATQPIKDVRPILSSFNDKTQIIPEFARREQLLREKFQKDNEHLLNNSAPNVNNFIAKLLGVPQQQITQKPKMPLDAIRENGQKQYEYFQNYLQENAAKFLEAEKQAKEEFGKVTLNKLITEGAPNPEDLARAQAEALEKQK